MLRLITPIAGDQIRRTRLPASRHSRPRTRTKPEPEPKSELLPPRDDSKICLFDVSPTIRIAPEVQNWQGALSSFYLPISRARVFSLEGVPKVQLFSNMLRRGQMLKWGGRGGKSFLFFWFLANQPEKVHPPEKDARPNEPST